MHLRFHWVSENSFTESSNRSLAYDPMGPKPQDCIHTAGDKIIQHTQEVHRKRAVEAHKLQNKKLAKPTHRDETELELSMRELSNHIGPDSLYLAKEQYDQSESYKCALCCTGPLEDSRELTIYVKKDDTKS